MNQWKKLCAVLLAAALLLAANTLGLQGRSAKAAQVSNTDFAIGSYVYFGTYPQTAAANDETPIEWQVLDRNGNKALLLSRYGLDAQPYHSDETDMTWADCSLRKWLNKSFIFSAFDNTERSAIMTTHVRNSYDQLYDGWETDGGNDTQDKLFLLSYAEANGYLGVTNAYETNLRARIAPTQFAVLHGAYADNEFATADGKASGWWLLRSPGCYQYSVAIVCGNGKLGAGYLNLSSYCIRPAMWVDISVLMGKTAGYEPPTEGENTELGEPVNDNAPTDKTSPCAIFSPTDGALVNVNDPIAIEWDRVNAAGVYYINVYRIGADGNEFVWGTDVWDYEANKVEIPAKTLTSADYLIEVRAWEGSGGHNDYEMASDSITITAPVGLNTPADDDTASVGFTTPSDGDTVPVGQKLSLEWTQYTGAKCYSVSVSPASSANRTEWDAQLSNGELSVEIPRSTLVESDYLIELKAWADEVYGTELFSQTISIHTYNKYEDASDKADEQVDAAENAVQVSGEYSYQFLEDGTIAFAGFSGRGPLDVPETIDGYTVTAIADGACYWNSALTMVSIPETVKTIGANAFSWCMSMEQVDIGYGVTHIGDSAFSNNSSLKWIHFADSITHMGEYVCSNCPEIGDVALPEQLISMGEGVFSSCDNLWGIVIPSGVRVIPDSAFFCCPALAELELPEGLTEIGELAFYGCEALQSVHIPDSVKVVSEWAFSGCSKLSQLSMSDDAVLGDGAFSNCAL